LGARKLKTYDLLKNYKIKGEDKNGI